MRYVSGKVLTADGFIDGHVGFQDGMVIEVGKGVAVKAEAKGIIIPTLTDAHTHIADYLVPVDLSLSLEELVAPPDGLKHRMLRLTSEKELGKAFQAVRSIMLRRGCSRFLDFREGGAKGARALRQQKGWPKPFVMGRPLHLRFDRQEVDSVLRSADGIGISSVSDWDEGELSDLAKYVRSKRKPFAIHVSERVREDIDQVLDLRPSFVVHMTMAKDGDIEACVNQKVTIVACPRSNYFFGRTSPLDRMLKAGATVALGTDNAMFTLPDMLAEMECAARALRQQGVVDVSPVLSMALENGKKLLMRRAPIGMEPGAPCDFMVMRSHGGDPTTDLVLRGSSADPLMVCLGGEEWRGVE
jgi:cytosine/adenosine deaminase-related metal-dependent hydrolase